MKIFTNYLKNNRDERDKEREWDIDIERKTSKLKSKIR